MDFHRRKCVLAGAYSVEDEEVLQSYYQMGKVHWVGLIGGMYQIFCMGVAKLMSMDHFSGFMGIRYIRIFSLWILKELQFIWVQLQLIWVWFFECALGHVDQIHIYILTYVMLIFMCRYNWHCSAIHTYCICNYTYFFVLGLSVSVGHQKKLLSYRLYTYLSV
jgi:hypothetical protein